ncbi:MAG: hypothetical protein Q4B08_13700, partial [Propionibacteriaceae bacterium]|nr:hypothetical protein [Propionibacteriaceae bacterium]
VRRPCRFSTIWTAVAPEAVFTFRRNGLMTRHSTGVISAHPHQPEPTMTTAFTQTQAPNLPKRSNSGQKN